MCFILYLTVGHTLRWVGGSCIKPLQLVSNRLLKEKATVHVCSKICLNPLKPDFFVILFCFAFYLKARCLVWCDLTPPIRCVLIGTLRCVPIRCVAGKGIGLNVA